MTNEIKMYRNVRHMACLEILVPPILFFIYYNSLSRISVEVTISSRNMW